jgi:hypothetical protein
MHQAGCTLSHRQDLPKQWGHHINHTRFIHGMVYLIVRSLLMEEGEGHLLDDGSMLL